MTNSLSHAVPERIGDMTPSWLTETLRASIPNIEPNIEIAGVEVLDSHSDTMRRARLGLESAPGSDGSATVFGNLPPFAEGQRRLIAATDMGRREAL